MAAMSSRTRAEARSLRDDCSSQVRNDGGLDQVAVMTVERYV